MTEPAPATAVAPVADPASVGTPVPAWVTLPLPVIAGVVAFVVLMRRRLLMPPAERPVPRDGPAAEADAADAPEAGAGSERAARPPRELTPVQLLLGGLTLWLAAQIAAGVALALLVAQDGEVNRDAIAKLDLFDTALVLLAGQGAGLALAAGALFLPGARRSLGLLGRLGKTSRVASLATLAVLPMALAVAAVVGVAADLIARLRDQPPPSAITHDTLAAIAADPWAPATLLTIAAVVFIVPVFEEVVYRGFLQSGLRRLAPKPSRGSVTLAVVSTSVLFTLAHLTVTTSHAWVVLFGLSLAMGVAYERTGRLAVPIVIHVVFNAVNIGLALAVS